MTPASPRVPTEAEVQEILRRAAETLRERINRDRRLEYVPAKIYDLVLQ